MQEYRTQGGEREKKLGQQLLGWPLVRQEQCKRELQKAPVVLCHFWHPIRNEYQPFYNNQGLHAASPTFFSRCQYSGSDTHPSSSVPHGIPDSCSPFPCPTAVASFSCLSSASPREGNKVGKDQLNCISVTTNKREAPNCLRQSLHYLSHEHQKFCIIYKNTLLHF